MKGDFFEAKALSRGWVFPSPISPARGEDGGSRNTVSLPTTGDDRILHDLIM